MLREITIGVAGNDWDIERRMSQKLASSRYESATTLTGGIGFLAQTRGGATIHATLSVSLQARSGEPDVYYGTVQGSDLVAQLPVGTYPDQASIWECVRFGTDYEDWEELRVRRLRSAA